MNKKLTVPVMSAGAKFLGLTQPEYAINLFFVAAYFYFFSFLTCAIIIAFQIFLNILYVQFFSKLEENFFQVAFNALKIPSVIYGHIRRPIPIFRSKLSKSLGNTNSK